MSKILMLSQKSMPMTQIIDHPGARAYIYDRNKVGFAIGRSSSGAPEVAV